MTNSSASAAILHSIADVERDTGLSKDILRVWERRYGFPSPLRDALGERQYDDAQLTRLRHIRRLIDAGHRPGRVVSLPLEALMELNTQAQAGRIQPRRSRASVAAARDDEVLLHWMQLLLRQDTQALRDALARMLVERGLARLLTEGVAPMNVRVGEAWLAGQLAVYQEHLYTEIVQAVLRQALGQLAQARALRPPRVLLTTLPGEAHGLGLLMAECCLVLEGCQTVPLGVQTPLPEIVQAAVVGGADIVALGFTAGQNPREVRAALEQLRERLPASVQLWAGGQCPALYRTPRGEAGKPAAFSPMGRLQDIAMGVAHWRSLAGQAA